MQKRFVGIDKKKAYIAVFGFCFIVLTGLFVGDYLLDSNYKDKVDQVKQESAKESGSNTPVTGNHLYNVPKDYKTLAEKEKEYQQEKSKQDNESYSNDSYAARRNQDVASSRSQSTPANVSSPTPMPQAPYVPPPPSGATVTKAVDPAEEAYARALEKQLELKAKANASPIKFELNKD